jgi:hypothetical protein
VQKTMSDAAEVIGAGRPDDYLLLPIEHAEGLRATAPKLAALLTRSAPMESARQMQKPTLRRLPQRRRSSAG